MKQFLLPALLLFLSVPFARADELVRKVQTELKAQGFYYNDVTGVNNPETAAAIKRFQIRNGMEVTGTLNTETLKALGVTSDSPPAVTSIPPAPRENAPAPAQPPALAPVPARPPVNLRKEATVQDRDHAFLDRESNHQPGYADPSAVPPPTTIVPPGEPGQSGYAGIFTGTPYQNAPAAVQQSTVRKAQALLARAGFYRDQIDGAAGPAIEEALLSYQRYARLTLTGRLDMPTLSRLNLLPARTQTPPVQPFRVPPGTKTYRGIWIE